MSRRHVRSSSTWSHGAVLLGLALGLLPGCSSSDCRETGASPPPAPAIDQALVAYLSMASALHHEADLAETEQDPRKAREALSRLLAAKIPGNFTEIREVRADTLARSAELALGAAELDEAHRLLEQGFAEVPEESYFRGRLFEISGLLLSQESKAAEQAGNLALAVEKRQLAISHLESTVRIQQAVIERAIADGGTP